MDGLQNLNQLQKGQLDQSLKNATKAVDTRRSKEALTKTVSTWGVIRGWDRATEKMNACFTNLLLDL